MGGAPANPVNDHPRLEQRSSLPPFRTLLLLRDCDRVYLAFSQSGVQSHHHFAPPNPPTTPDA